MNEQMKLLFCCCFSYTKKEKMHGGWSSVKVRDKEQQLQIRKLVSLAFHISLYFETEIFSWT